MTKLFQSTLLGALACSISITSYAADFTVSVTNLTRGVYFTPLLVTAHDPALSIFTSGSAASPELQAVAEGGDISSLSALLTGAGATVVENPAGGLLAPGDQSPAASAMLNTDSAPSNTQLSIVAMMLPTNDAFIGLNSITVPTSPGVYTYNVNAYDAGTEANDEVQGSGAPNMAGFPAPGPVAAAVGTGGTGVGAVAEGFVHIHRNVLGDNDASGGVSDIDATVHRWLNPVARVVVTVN